MKFKYFLGGLLFASFFIAAPAQVQAKTENESDAIYKFTPANRELPWIPEDYHDTDWKAIASDSLERILGDSKLRYASPGLYHTEKTRVGFVTDANQEPTKENVEAVTLLTLLLSVGSLDQEVLNVTELKELATKLEGYYSLDEGETAFLNYLDVSSRELTFYDQVYPGLLYFMVMDRLEPTENSDKLLRQIADGWHEVVMDLGGKDRLVDFVFTGYDFAKEEPFHRDGIIEVDGAAGVALLEFYAYQKFQDRKYIRAARYCMDYLDRFGAHYGSRLLYFYTPYLTARMNTEQGFSYDMARHMGVAFEPTRENWGWLGAENFGTGLVGNRNDFGGTAYTFESIMGLTALIPTVKYDARYASEIGRAILHTSSQLAGQYQLSFHSKDGRVGSDSIQAQAALGYFASMIEPTEQEGILKVDLNAGDFYQTTLDNFCFMLFNPYEEEAALTYEVASDGEVGLYDLVTEQFIALNVRDVADLKVPAQGAVVLIEIPIEAGDNQYKLDRKVERQTPNGAEASIQFADLHENDRLTEDTEIQLEMFFRDSNLSNLSIFVDGNEVYKNVGYEKPFVLKLDDVTPGYHLLQAKMTTSAGTVDSAYIQVFVEKDEDIYYGPDAEELQSWQGESPVFELDFSQSPILELNVSQYKGPWFIELIDQQSGVSYMLEENSTKAGQIKINLEEAVEQADIRLYGKHVVAFRYSPQLELEMFRLYEDGFTALEPKQWAAAFMPQQMINWPGGQSGQLNYRHGAAIINEGVAKTDWFEMQLDKKPRLKIKVKEALGTWALMAYLEGEDGPKYLQYPTDKSGTFTYELEGNWDVMQNELHNIQFWIVSQGEVEDPHTFLDYLSLAYEPSFLRLGSAAALGAFVILAMLVEMRRES